MRCAFVHVVGGGGGPGGEGGEDLDLVGELKDLGKDDST